MRRMSAEGGAQQQGLPVTVSKARWPCHVNKDTLYCKDTCSLAALQPSSGKQEASSSAGLRMAKNR